MSASPPYCWFAGEPERKFFMHATARDGEVGLKIMGDTLTCGADDAIAFGRTLIEAGESARKDKK